MKPTDKEPSSAQTKLAAAVNGEKSVSVFFTPRTKKPVCNESCTGCYYFANYSAGSDEADIVITAEDVPAVLGQLAGGGFSNAFLMTSELLLAPNWKALVKTAGYTYLNTNGKIIAQRGIPLLREIAEAGIEQLVITANLTPCQEELNLTRSEVVEAAFAVINQYNTENPTSTFVTVATSIITSKNYNQIAEMCVAVKERYRADKVRFIAYIPLKGGSQALAPSLEQLAIAGEQIEAMRQQYRPGDLYIARGGTIGSQGLPPAKKDTFCPAGASLFAVNSMEDGSRVTPCIYIPTFPVGQMRDGRVVLDEQLQRDFLETKQRAIDAGYCPALALATGMIK